jgi:hypothetical protein
MKPKPPLTTVEQEKAKILSASGKSPNAIAKGMGRNRRTVQKFLCKPEVREQVSVQREELAGMFEHVAHRVIDSVTGEDIEKANLVQKMTSAGIAIDKAAMLRDVPPVSLNITALLDVVHLIREKRDREDDRQMEEYRKAHGLTPALPLPEHES